MPNLTRRIAAAAILSVGLLTPSPARADQIRVLSSVALKAVLESLLPEFERATSHTVVPVFGIAAAIKTDIENGTPFDLAILTPAMLDDLAAKGLLAAGSRPVIARAGLGVMIKAGARKPDVGSVDAFTRALLSANSIAYVPNSASGAAFLATSEKLGIREAVTAKARPAASVDDVAAQVVGGTADLAVLPVSEILPVRGADVGGIFPAAIQTYIVMAGGIGARSAGPGAARALLEFLTAAANTPVVKAHGMDR